MANIDVFMTNMEAAVAKAEAGEASTSVLLAEFTKYVAANKTDPVALQAFVDRVNASGDKLAASAAANPDPDATD